MLGRLLKGSRYGNTRSYQRLPAAWPIKCAPQAEGKTEEVTSTSDVSAGGVAILSHQEIPVGSRIRLEIHVPPLNRSIPAEGVVVRCRPARVGKSFELGIRFSQIDPADRIALNEAVEGSYGPRQTGSSWWDRWF